MSVAAATDTEQTNGWNITTACDISLASLFEGSPPSSFLDIDTDAIAQSLETLSPGSQGNLTFTATSIEDLNFDSAPHGDLTRGVAWYEKDMPTSSNVKVAVGGLPINTRGGSIMELTFSLAESSLIKSGVLMNIIKPKPKRFPQRLLQAAGIHELQHVADFQDESIVKEQRKADRLLKRKIQALAIGSLLIAPLATTETIQMTHLGDTVASIAVGAATMVFGLLRGGQTAKKMRRKAYFESPFEKRAFTVMEKGKDFPALVSFKSASA